MSSLIIYTDEAQALVATDSISVDGNGEPIMFCEKATYIPHLKTIVAGTGQGGFANAWALKAGTQMIVRGIMNLDFHTPIGLRKNWEDYTEQKDLDNHATTTVYMIGFSEEDGKVKAFAYRSKDNFVSESIGYGTAVKPECEVIEGDVLQAVPKMMEQQRMIQNQIGVGKKIFIGGEIFAYHLTEGGCNIFSLGKFQDFEHDNKRIEENYGKHSEQD